MAITPEELQPNFYSLEVDPLNIVSAAGGSIMSGGVLQSPNFLTGQTGWKIDSNGTAEFVNATVTGTLTATSGQIGGWTINSTSIYTGTEDHSGYTANAGDMTLYSDGSDASLHAYNWYIDTSGNLVTRNATITGIQAGSEIAIQGWQYDGAFSATDLNTVAWAAGTLTLLDGTTYSITGANTGNMSARTYIYFDKGTSTTAFQTTTTASTAVGTGKILVAVAEDSTTQATFQVFGGLGGLKITGVDIESTSITNTQIAANTIRANEIAANTITAAEIAANTITASEIAANTITANEIAANTITASEITAGTITATEMTIATLSAITANMGAITSGTITVDTSGHIKGGQTDYNTGTGFFLGYSGAAYKFSVGNPAGNYITWDGSTLTVNGYALASDVEYGAGTLEIQAANTERSTTNNTYTKLKDIAVAKSGTVTVAYDAYSNALEDFTSDWAETDPNNRLSQTATVSTFTAIDNNEDTAYLGKDFGASYFSGDFTHYFSINVSSCDNEAVAVCWLMSNTQDDMYDLQQASADYLWFLFTNNAGAYTLQVGEGNAGSQTYDGYASASLSTEYYIKLIRDESVGTYGHLYAYIYSDSGFSTLVDTLDVTLTEKQDFRYLAAPTNYSVAGASKKTTGTVSNLLTTPTYARIYVDEVATGTEYLLPSAYATFSENISVDKADNVQLYLKSDGSNSSYCRNFKIKADAYETATVVTD